MNDPGRLQKILNKAKEAQRLDPSITTIQPLIQRLSEDLVRLKERGRDIADGDVSKSEEWFDFDHLQQRRADCQALKQEWGQMMEAATELEAIAASVLSGPQNTQAVMRRNYVHVKDMERWTAAYNVLGIPPPTPYPLTQFYQSLSVIEMMYQQGRVVSEAFTDHVKAVFDETAANANTWFAFLTDRYGQVMKWKYCFVPRLELDVAEAVAALESELDCSDEERALIAQNVPVAQQQLEQIRTLMDQLLVDFVEYDPRERVDDALKQLLELLEAIEASLEPLWVVQGRSLAKQYEGMTLDEYYEAWKIDF